MQMRSKVWSKPEEAALRRLWKRSSNNLGRFKDLVSSDTLLKKRSWNTCSHKARHMGLFEGVQVQHDTQKYPFAALTAKELDRLDGLLRDQGVMAAKAAFPQYTEKQLRNRAVTKDIKLGHSAEEAKERDEKSLIKSREAGEISAAEFLEQLPKASELRVYWRVIHGLLKQKSTIRNTDLLPFAKELMVKGSKRVHKLNAIRGILAKFVEWDALFTFKIEGNLTYFCNLPGFYTPAELHRLVPREEVDRIAAHVDNDVPRTAWTIAELAYGRDSHGSAFVATVLDRFVESGLFKYAKKEQTYVLTPRGVELGQDTQTLMTLDVNALENELAAQTEAQTPDPAQLTLKQLEEALDADLRAKRVRTVDLTDVVRGQKNWKLLPLAEVLIGNQFTDMRLLNWMMERTNPDLTLVSGLVQGAFAGIQVDKRRVLVGESLPIDTLDDPQANSGIGLNKPGHQITAAGNVLRKLEEITRGNVHYFLGDDDEAVALDYAKLAQLAEGKIWQHGVSMGSLTFEQNRRLMIREFYAKRRIQIEVILPYQYRIKRSLYNAAEVESRIGVRKSEYRLIVEILVAKRHKLSYPKKYEKVVEAWALEGNRGKTCVSADTLSFTVNGREFVATHNTNFSPITQYVDPIFAMESQIRQRLAAGHKVPFWTMDFQQEMYYGGYLGDDPDSGGHWFMTVPGMQNSLQESEYKMRANSRGVLTSKSHRQNTFRKKLAIPGAPELEFLDDGRIRMRILNNRVRRILEEQKDQPEICEGIAFVTDSQHGSLTMCAEAEAKYMDYALYHRRAKHLYENGDVLHGNNYPQTYSENRPLRLTSLNSQKEFTLQVQKDLISQAPALEVFGCWLGNHEWNTFGRHLTGTNDLEFLVDYVRGLLDARQQAGQPSVLKEAFNVSRIRWGRTSNPTQGDLINWPYYSRVIGGFKLAISHLWMMRGGGRTPIDKQRKWLTGMAHAAGDVDFMFGGHWHSLWWCQEAEKMLLQVPSAASQSGYELVLGMSAVTMFTYIEVSNRTGVTLEFIPWEYLMNTYKCQSPAYKGKDAELERPKPGTLEHQHGKMSPLVEKMIDDCTFYTTV